MMNSQLPERIAPAQPPPPSGNNNVISQFKRYNQWLADTGPATRVEPSGMLFMSCLTCPV